MAEKREWIEPVIEVLSEDEVLSKWSVDLVAAADKQINVINPTITWDNAE